MSFCVLQPVASGEFDQCAFDRIDEIVRYITDAGNVALLDMHQSAFRDGQVRCALPSFPQAFDQIALGEPTQRNTTR